jgi:hypothetical protein
MKIMRFKSDMNGGNIFYILQMVQMFDVHRKFDYIQYGRNWSSWKTVLAEVAIQNISSSVLLDIGCFDKQSMSCWKLKL